MKVEPSYHPLYGTSGRGVPYRRGARRNPLFCQGYRGDRNQNGSHISDGIEDKSDPSVRFFYYLGIFVSYHDPNEIFTLRCHRLIGCFPLRAQTPEDNLRDEEYYPFQNGYEEPYSPMIDTDSSLFYRAIQSTGDLFRDATDFKFSFVAYNRRGEPYRPDRMSLNGIRLPSRYIPSMNALYPQKYGEPMNGWHLPTTLDAEYRTSEEPLLPERNAALQFSGRNYLMGSA